ncbi:hypothetical protein M422DRAFT_241116 [Sphaerobolus stellatus SS14]|nr:hypothetical protein M422DRAFT_241116 [Sphaerobolus stellatus SS14]
MEEQIESNYSDLCRQGHRAQLKRYPYGSNSLWNFNLSDGPVFGPYQHKETIESENSKIVFRATDYSLQKNCKESGVKNEVVVKISTEAAPSLNEKIFYEWDKTERSASDIQDFPNLLHAGKDAILPGSALVLESMGDNLDRLKPFTPKETLAIAIQLRLHAKGWLHCNAKPGNFVVGRDKSDTKGRIFMIDFEYSRRASVVPNPPTKEGGGWNRIYCSVDWSQHRDPTYRDDLEGLAYVLSCLEKGGLPWKALASVNFLELERLKMTTTTSKLFQGMDPVYIRYFNAVKSLAWGEMPDYDAMIQDFMKVWESRSYGCTPYEIDW